MLFSQGFWTHSFFLGLVILFFSCISPRIGSVNFLLKRPELVQSKRIEIFFKDPTLVKNYILQKQIRLQFQSEVPSQEINLSKIQLTILKWEEKETINYWFYPLSLVTLGFYALSEGEISRIRFQLIGSWEILDRKGDSELQFNFNEVCSIPQTIYTPVRTNRIIAASHPGGVGVKCRSKVVQKAFQLLAKKMQEREAKENSDE